MSEKLSPKELVASLAGKLVVSCQDYTEVMIKAALRGGASGLRINSPGDVRIARGMCDLPIIACNKQHLPNSPIYITPTVRAATALCKSGAEFVALDCTNRRRVRQQPAEIIAAIHDCGGLAVADLANVEQGPAAIEAGADVLATTLFGDFDPRSIEKLAALGKPVLAEGHIQSPEQAHQAIDAGAWAVCVGSAITRPHLLTEQFKNALGA
jgi:putative N-acetylmannosamine-6-phosphate epimerase